MSKKPLCECNQRIAVLETAYVRAGEREHELRVELHAAKQKLAEMDALFGAYGDTLRPFLALMVRELKANSHKGDRDGWLGMTAVTAFNEITHHHDKLGEALSALDYPQISEYAADVANCCMMLLDVMGLLSASAEPSTPVERGSTHGFEQSPNTCRHLERSGVWWREGSITRTGRECNACGSVIEDPATEACVHEFIPFTKGCSKCGEPYSTEGANHETQ